MSAMKVIFTQAVSGVAERNDVREVADGYALNFLLPRGLAVRATPERLHAITQQSVSEQKTKARQQAQARSLAQSLRGKSIALARPASSTGTLYASVTPEMVSEALKVQFKVNLRPEQIVVPLHIKTIGEHQVQLSLGEGAQATLTINITPS